MSQFLPQEKGQTIRMPSTANLMVDSADRNVALNPSPFDFQISRTNSILNGFFTRIGTTEVVLEWNVANGDSLSALPGMVVTWATGPATQTVNPFVAGEFYTVEAAIKAFVAALNTAFGTNVFTQQPLTNGYAITTADNSNFSIALGTLQSKFGFLPSVATPADAHLVSLPDLRPYRYLDFVSQQLTYNQDLKDSSTNPIVRDVLCRWYMAWDQPPTNDAYGYPILMGYTPFVLRRLFSPPKQIRWDNIQPIGNISFQVYSDTNYVVPVPVFGNANWLMTLQVSEC